MKKEEIKEILDNFKNNYDELGSCYYPEDILGPEDLKLLYDYITNLQERNNNLKEDFKRHIDRINELTEKSDNLQEKINQYENPDDMTLFYMWLDEKAKDKMKQLQEENEYSNHCNEELRKKITNLEYKIEKLEEDNKQLKELCDKYEEEHKTTFEEWKKDINIIDELEKYINEEIEDYNKVLNSKLLSESGKEKYEAEKVCFLDMLDKLNEIKGSDKE